MTKKVVIIDYGSGNIASVSNALNLVKPDDFEVVISSKADDLKTASHIILPGVGAFGDCFAGIKAIDGMLDILKEEVLKKKKPFLGVCVGMQLLADKGFEHGENSGLGFISGEVIKISDQNGQLKIPHMGWNDLIVKANSHPVLFNIKSGDHFYFVHSYYFVAKNQSDVLASVNYGTEITAIIAKENIIATQFHPEKSGESGLCFLKNFLNWKF